MLAYRLRHRITFQRPVNVRDPDTGLDATDWVTAEANGVPLVDVPAEVLTGPGREQVAAGSNQASTAARINLRWFPGLVQGWRILSDGRVFDIQGIETDITGRREWRLQCVDGLSDGL